MGGVSRFLTAHYHNIRLYSAIHIGTRWKIRDRRQIKNRHTTKTKRNLRPSVCLSVCLFVTQQAVRTASQLGSNYRSILAKKSSPAVSRYCALSVLGRRV